MAAIKPRKLAAPAWRECSLTRVAEMESLLNAITAGRGETPLATAVRVHLSEARAAATGRHRFRARMAGSVAESARSNIDAAEATLLRMAPEDDVLGLLPSVQACVRLHLPATDSRRVEFERVAEELADKPTPSTAGRRRRFRTRPATDVRVSEDQRNIVVTALRAANSAALREHQQVRSFGNVLALTTFAMAVLAVTIGLFGWLRPEAMPLCFQPAVDATTLVVCPTAEADAGPDPAPAQVDGIMRDEADPVDLTLVELIGLTAAALAAAFSLRGVRGSSVPYSLLVVAAVLKLPLGALTAVLGLLLMRAQFVPGLSDLDSSAQILGWALVFGYAQQLFTGFVDRQAQTVLNAVNTSEPANPATPREQPADGAKGRVPADKHVRAGQRVS
jgi:hypothetical protein